MTAPFRTFVRAAATAAGLLAAATVIAAGPPQTVYRCGPDGRIYSQTPCQDGQAVNVEDSRSAAQQRAARETAERESRSAQQMAKERQQREAAVRGQQPIGIKPEPVAQAASAPKAKGKRKKAAPDDAGTMSPVMRVPASAAKP